VEQVLVRSTIDVFKVGTAADASRRLKSLKANCDALFAIFVPGKLVYVEARSKVRLIHGDINICLQNKVTASNNLYSMLHWVPNTTCSFPTVQTCVSYPTQ
jgi:hypothetical protein